MDGAGVPVVSGLTVGTRNANIVLDEDQIERGQVVRITSGKIVHP
jgi:hypothetical protein